MQIKKFNKKITLTLNNHSTYNAFDLFNIRLVYLLSNTTSWTQLFDASINLYYRKFITQKFADCLEEGKISKITLKNAVFFLTKHLNLLKNRLL